MPRFPPSSITEYQVLAALEASEGNQKRAAESLGLTQGWIAKWLKRHGYVQHVTWIKAPEDSSIA